MTPRRLLLFSFVFAIACAKKIEGPTPRVSAMQNERDRTSGPAYFCNAQGDPKDGWLVDVVGDDFAPLPTNTLAGTPALLMPVVKLEGPETYEVPPAWVRFAAKTRLPLAMRTAGTTADAHALEPGDYAVTVTNANGASGKAAAALRVIPPPTITAVSLTNSGGAATNICADQAQTLTITGAGFRTDLTPAVAIGSHTFTGASITTDTPTSLVVDIPAGTFTSDASAGGTTLTVRVTNPEGCAFPYGSAPAPQAQVTAYTTCLALGTLSISPRFGYMFRDTPVTITNAFTAPASKPFSGALPRVTITAPLAAGGGAVAVPLRSIAFVDERTITAVVPTCSGTSFGASSGADSTECPGLAPGGPYDVEVDDPVNGKGVITAGFTVVSSPPPLVTGLSPASITTVGGTVDVTGQSFDAGSTVLLATPVAGGVEFCEVGVTARNGTTGLTVSVPAQPSTNCYVEDAAGNRTPAMTGFSLGIGQYLVRVQHSTDVASGDYAALVVTSTSFNPTDDGVASSTLNVARGEAGAVVATDDLGQPFLYVAGGSTNGTDQLDGVEVAPVGLFGDLGGACSGGVCKFRALDRTPLPTARSGLQLVARRLGGAVGTSYLYALGGRTGATSLTNEIWRAQVLRTQDAPSMRQITVAAGNGPGAGDWYYKVAALLPAGDPLNANGAETLPSDEESVTLTASQQATVHFGCVTGANKYRIYRTASASAADAVSNTEVMLTDVDPACSGGLMTFSDDGSLAADVTKKPLPHGALGAWVDTGKTLSTSRFDFQARTLPTANSDIAVVGGCTAAAGKACTASAGSIESLTFAAPDDLDPAAVAAAGSGLIARDRFGMGIATAGTANVATGKTFLVVFGGEANGAELSGINQTVQAADIADFAFSALTGAPQNIGVGGWADVISNQGFSEATRTNNHTLFSKSGTLGAGPFSTTANFNLNLNAGVPPYSTGGTRFLAGEQLFRAFVYVTGGFQSDATFTATDTVERFVF